MNWRWKGGDWGGGEGLAIFKIKKMKTSVEKELSREFNNDPRVHMDAVFPAVFSYKKK